MVLCGIEQQQRSWELLQWWIVATSSAAPSHVANPYGKTQCVSPCYQKTSHPATTPRKAPGVGHPWSLPWCGWLVAITWGLANWPQRGRLRGMQNPPLELSSVQRGQSEAGHFLGSSPRKTPCQKKSMPRKTLRADRHCSWRLSQHSHLAMLDVITVMSSHHHSY